MALPADDRDEFTIFAAMQVGPGYHIALPFVQECSARHWNDVEVDCVHNALCDPHWAFPFSFGNDPGRELRADIILA